MAGRYFTGLTSGISQKFFHSKQEDTQPEGLQELLSHLQHKQTPSLQSLGDHPKSNVIENQPEATTPVLGGAKLDDEDLFGAEESGWGINDDDLIIEPLENQPLEDKKEVAPIRKESLHERKDLEEERKSTTPERKYSQNLDKSEKNSKTPSMDFSNTKAPNRHSAKGSAKYTPLQQITSKASNFISEIGKIGKTSKAEQMQPTSGGKMMKKPGGGGSSASDKYKVADPFGFEEVLHRLTVDPNSRNEPQARKTEGEDIKGRDSYSHFGNDDDHSQRLREQMQKYMAQAHQLEILVREEQDIMHEEHTKKIRNVHTLEEEANIRLEECQKKEKELRILDEKIKLKEELNIDENRLEEIAKQREETQEKISQLEEKNQFLEFTLKNDKEQLQQEMESKLNALREESQRQLQQREQELINNYEQIIKQQTDSYTSEITTERNRYNRLAKKVKDWASEFQAYKGSFKSSLDEIEQMLWTKGEEFETYKHKTKEIHEKVVQVTNSYKVRLDQKDHQAAKHVEIEKGLKEELASVNEEKNRIISEKDKEIKEFKTKLNKLEEKNEIEKDNVLMLQTKFDEASMKMHTSEQMAKTFEKEKNELKKNLETEKKNSAALQAKLDELSKKGKEGESSLKNFEKSIADLKKELEAEKKKNKTLQGKLDENSTKEKAADEKFIALQKRKEELERSLEDETGRSMALQLTLDEITLADKNKERRIKTLEKDKSDLEEKYMKELKDLKGENYRSEESYLQEIEKLTSEIEELKKEAAERQNSSKESSPSKLSALVGGGKANRKKSEQEAQKKINELIEQIDNMNKEKIQLGERFKRDKTELIEGYDQRFKSLNLYIEELYTKNHQLTEENTLLNGKFNQLKDKLTALDTSFKNLAAQSHDHSHKNELNQLLAHLDFISEAPKETNEPISPQLRAELRESLRQETEKRASSPTFKKEDSKRSSPTLKVTAPLIETQEVPLSPEGNLLVSKSPTIKDLTPAAHKEYEAPDLLEGEGNVRMPENWGNLDVLIPGKTEDGERAKSAFDRTQQQQLFSGLQTGGKVESANAIIGTGGAFREDELVESPKFSQKQSSSSRPGSAIPLELQASSPEFKGRSTESPKFENNQEGRLTPVDPEKLDLDSPTFQGRKLGDFVEEGPEKDAAEVGEVSLLRVSSTPKGERRDSGLFKSMEKMKEVKMSMSSRREKSNETFSNKSNSPGLKSPERKSKEASPLKSSNESPKFGMEKSFHEEENSKPEKQDVSPLVQEGQWGLDDLDVNLETVEEQKPKEEEEVVEPLVEDAWGGDIKIESPVKVQEEIVEPLVEDAWGGDIKIESPAKSPAKFQQEEETVEPLLDEAWGGDVQAKSPAKVAPAEDVEPLVDDAWGTDVQIEDKPAATEEETGVTAWDTNIDVIESPAVQASQNKSPAKRISSPLKKSSASPLKQESVEDLNVESAWDTNIDFIQSPAIQNKSPSPKKVSSPLKKSSASPLKQEPVEDLNVESAWDTNIDFIEPPTTKTQSPATKKVSSPVKESAGWDVGVDLDINLEGESKISPKLSPAKESTGSGKKDFESSPSMKNSLQNAGEGSERGSMSQLDSKVSLGSSITRSTGKLTVPNVFDFSGKKTAASGTKTEEKKKGGLVINKIVLPKKGATGSKLNLGKAKEDKDDVDLEEFLGTSMK